MKRLLLLLIVVFLVGCDVDALSYYKEAEVKTSTIESAQSKLDLEFNMNFSESVLDENPELEDMIGRIVYQDHSQFNKNERVSRQYLGNDVFGVDTVYYKKDDLEYLLIPFFSKYLLLNELSFEDFDATLYSEPPITSESIEKIETLWRDLVSEDDVVNLGDEIIDSPEGEVKVKKFVVSFSNAQIQSFLLDVLEVVEADPIFEERIRSYPAFIVENDEVKQVSNDLPMEEMLEDTKLLLENIVVDEFKMVSYIDIDQYVVQTNYEVQVSFKGLLDDVIESVGFKGAFQLFDLHEEQELVFPTIDDANKTTVKELIEKFGDLIDN